MSAQGIVAVMDVHRVVLDIDTDAGINELFARCLCGWESGREEAPLTSSLDEESRVVLWYAAYYHLAEKIISEGMA